MPEESMNGPEGLQIIQEMINKAKNQFSENGFLYLLWGWVILFCSMGQFILMHIMKYEKHYIIWFLTWLALLVQIIYLVRKKRKRQVKTYTEGIIKYIWICFLIVACLLSFGLEAIFGDSYFKYLYPFILIAYGIPTFLSGIILQFKPLVAGGIACWLFSIIAMYIPYDYQLVLLSAAVIIAWIIPGYLLKQRFNQQTNL